MFVQSLLTNLALAALRGLVKYAENEITDHLVKDVESKTIKGKKKSLK